MSFEDSESVLLCLLNFTASFWTLFFVAGLGIEFSHPPQFNAIVNLEIFHLCFLYIIVRLIISVSKLVHNYACMCSLHYFAKLACTVVSIPNTRLKYSFKELAIPSQAQEESKVQPNYTVCCFLDS